MNTIIQVQNLERDFQVGSETVRALKGISFSINEGDL